MTTAVYPGSFDPVTLGHFDIIMRTSQTMDRVVIGVLNNQAKKPLFTVEERVEMLKSVTQPFSNVEIQCFDGLTIDFARKNHAQVIIRGLRAVTDFEYELRDRYDVSGDQLKVFLFKFKHCQRDCFFRGRNRRISASAGGREDAGQICPVKEVAGVFGKQGFLAR